jgi:predicted PurR-regulated permease PerM
VTVKAVSERRARAEQEHTADQAAQAVAPQDVTPASDATVSMPVDIRNAALTMMAALALIVMLQYAQAMIIPVVLGILISYALEPIVARLVRAHVPRPLGAAIVLLLLVSSVCWLLYSLRGEANAIVEQLPQAARHMRQAFEDGKPKPAGPIAQVQKAATELEKAADAAAPAPAPPPQGVTRVQVETPPFAIGDYLVWGSIGIATAVGQTVLILFLVYFLLASGDLYKRKIVKIVGPSLSKKKITLQILADIDRQIEWFLFVQALTSTLVAVATWLAFRAVGLEQAAVWGVLAGIFNSIPYFGPVLVTGGTAIVAYIQFGSIRMALSVAGMSLAITSLEGFLLTPWLTSRAARMNAVAIFVGLLFWGWVWNVWGMLLAVPMLMVLKAISDHVEDFKPIGELLGD